MTKFPGACCGRGLSASCRSNGAPSVPPRKPGRKLHMRFRRIGIIVGAWLMLLAAPRLKRRRRRTSRTARSASSSPIRRAALPTCSRGSSRRTCRSNGRVRSWSKFASPAPIGSIAAEEVARAAPDGYTWLLVTTFFTASPSLNTALRWDPVRDFIPIGQVCRAPNFFVVPTALPVKNVAEFVALAKAKPGEPELQPSGQGLDRASRLRAVQAAGWDRA